MDECYTKKGFNELIQRQEVVIINKIDGYYTVKVPVKFGLWWFLGIMILLFILGSTNFRMGYAVINWTMIEIEVMMLFALIYFVRNSQSIITVKIK